MCTCVCVWRVCCTRAYFQTMPVKGLRQVLVSPLLRRLRGCCPFLPGDLGQSPVPLGLSGVICRMGAHVPRDQALLVSCGSLPPTSGPGWTRGPVRSRCK